jgi:FkbM family methyltransferase
MGSDARPRIILRGLASGYRIDVSPRDSLGYLLGTYEPHLQRTIRTMVRGGDTVYDIGANRGYVTLCLAKAVGPQGKVVAFEPMPETAQALHCNLRLNRIANVSVIACAASDSAGTATFRVADSLSTASMVWHRDHQHAREVRVACVQIDEEVASARLSLPSFVKIDVEGAEGFVVRGMRRTLESARPVIFLECSDKGREQTWEILKNLNYRCFSAVAMNRIASFDEYRHADFLWLPA